MKPTLYVCAGIYRSGSTWLYNTVRIALGVDYTTAWVQACSGEPSNIYQPDDPRMIHVVKTHAYREDLAKAAKVVFMTRRDLRDVAASAVRVKKIENNTEAVLSLLRQVVASYDQWKTGRVVEIVYEEMIQDKVAATQEILKVLKLRPLDRFMEGEEDLPGDAGFVHGRVEQLKPPPETAETHDPVTLLTPGHVTDGRAGSYSETLDADTVSRIEDEFGKWLKQKGYM